MEGFNKRQVNTLLEYLKRFGEWKHSNIKNEQTGSFQKLKQMWKKWTTEKQKHITLGIRNTKKLGKYKKKFTSIDDKNQSENKR